MKYFLDNFPLTVIGITIGVLILTGFVAFGAGKNSVAYPIPFHFDQATCFMSESRKGAIDEVEIDITEMQ